MNSFGFSKEYATFSRGDMVELGHNMDHEGTDYYIEAIAKANKAEAKAAKLSTADSQTFCAAQLLPLVSRSASTALVT